MSLAFLRLLISDTEPDSEGNHIFSDDQLQLFIDSTKNIYFAAASALRTIAANEILLTKYIRTDDLLVDGSIVSKELRLLALDYENRGISEGNNSEDSYDAALVVSNRGFLRVPEGTESLCRW